MIGNLVLNENLEICMVINDTQVIKMNNEIVDYNSETMQLFMACEDMIKLFGGAITDATTAARKV